MLIWIHSPAKSISWIDADFRSILEFDTLHRNLVLTVLGLNFHVKAIIVCWKNAIIRVRQNIFAFQSLIIYTYTLLRLGIETIE